jgi:hypothetical protein
MIARFASGVFFLVMLTSCGHWTQRCLPLVTVTLADGGRYEVEYRIKEYDIPSHAYSDKMSESETAESITKAEEYLRIYQTDNKAGDPVLTWSDRPGIMLIIVQCYKNAVYVVAQRHDPKSLVGHLVFYRSVMFSMPLVEIDPNQFPPELAYSNINSGGIRDGIPSSFPWQAIGRATPTSYPYFNGGMTGSVWDSIMTGDTNADFQRRPGYEDRLREFQKLYGKP